MAGTDPAPLNPALPNASEPVGPAPRPHTNEEILAMMAQTGNPSTSKADDESGSSKKTSVSAGWSSASFWLLWASIFTAIGATVYVSLTSSDGTNPALLLAGGFAVLIVLFLVAGALGMFSPVLLTGAVLRRATGKSANEAAGLAGSDILGALGLAESVLDTDRDARLVTRRDGVVTYANRAYFELARLAGVTGPAGLPPRIDRLFAQQGAEATKVFRLCKAAKSGEAGEEIIYQVMGLEGGGERRRFEVSVRPVPSSTEHVAWCLRELPIEEDAHDALAASFADFTRPVFALEKSGQIAWTNAELRNCVGAARGGIRHIDDLILGETAETVRELWRLDRSPQKAMVRRAGSDPVNGEFIAFRRGGVGEGFACVELAVEKPSDDEEIVSLSGDISESPFGIAMIDGEINRDARIVESNKSFNDAFSDIKKNTPLSKLFSQETLEELAKEIRRKAKSGGAPSPVEANVGKGADVKTFALYARPIRRKRGSYGTRRIILYSVDVTDRKQMEDGFAQDQKLRGIGELASKVAHDFNNYLQVVLGHCERLMLKHPAGDPAYQELVQIRENAQRAANTTKQLLAFSRKQTLKREILSITEILRDFSRFLTRAIGENVQLEMINGRGLPSIKVDKYQLETALMNLAVNARDAMGAEGGTLTVSTRFVPEDEVAELNVAGLTPQDYVLISVADTGPGISEEVAEKIFEPFFTTKELGKGTGLGLSTVYGIVRQLDGIIHLQSKPGDGATFKIFLPSYDEEPQSDEEKTSSLKKPYIEPQDLTGAGRILVVEDEDPVRNFVMATLNDCGYEVEEAEDGDHALEIFEEEGVDFDLVISDVMMPGLDGPSMVKAARERFGLKSKVIFMSAYAEAAVRDQLDIIEGAGYIQKPFTLKAVAAQVKQALYEDRDQDQDQPE